MKPMKFKEHIIFWVTKIGYVGIFIVLPMFFAGVVPTSGRLWCHGIRHRYLHRRGLPIGACGGGYRIRASTPPMVIHIEAEWAIHQVNTTVNFATQNKVWNWLFGGLNFQVEHHLFPRISHIHYPELNKRLKQVCAEFNVQYREFPTLRSALLFAI
jgi:linoleoyl-CoA desaturase